MNEITEENYRRLKSEVEDTKAEAQRAQGALDQLTKRLREEFGCGSLKEAETKLEEMEAKKARMEAACVKAMVAYRNKWKGTNGLEE